MISSLRPAVLTAVVALIGGLETHPACGAEKASIDKSAYTLFYPTPDGALRDFTPDRPTRSTTPITVDAGHWQIESDFLLVTKQWMAGASTRTFQAVDPVIKLGLTSDVELDFGLGGYNDVLTRSTRTAAALSRGRGFGDITLTTKINLLGNDGGTVAFAVAPYLQLPTGARNVTDGQVEGGVIAPVALTLPNDFEVTLQTEIDALANENGPGTHVSFTNLVNVSHPFPGLKELTGLAEFYTRTSTERAGNDVYSADLGLAYLINPDTQLDFGANLGLTRTSGRQIYSGVAHRF